MRLPFFALTAALLLAVAAPAHAKLEICNRTPSPFSVAIAYETGSDIISQGWWTIDADKCTTVIDTDLTRRYYYHYVRSRALNVEWAGSYSFCTNDDPQFRISGSGSCEDRKFHITGFRQIDVSADGTEANLNKDYTLDISMGPAPVTPPVAQAPAVQPAVEAPVAPDAEATTTTEPAPTEPTPEAVPAVTP